MPLLELAHGVDRGYMFENFVFPTSISWAPPTHAGHLATGWPQVEGVNILDHLYYEPLDTQNFHNFKILVNPRAVRITSVHGLLDSAHGCVQVPSKVAHMYHTRYMQVSFYSFIRLVQFPFPFVLFGMDWLLVQWMGYGYVECVWLIAGLQPHLARVRLIRLWGWVRLHTWWYMGVHGTQDKPAIKQMLHAAMCVWYTWQCVTSARLVPSSINGFITIYTLPVSCVWMAHKSHSWHVAGVNCYIHIYRSMFHTFTNLIIDKRSEIQLHHSHL